MTEPFRMTRTSRSRERGNTRCSGWKAPREGAGGALGPSQGSLDGGLTRLCPGHLGGAWSSWATWQTGDAANSGESAIEAGKGRRPRRGYQPEKKRGWRPGGRSQLTEGHGRYARNAELGRAGETFQNQMEGKTQRGCQRGRGSSFQDEVTVSC